jgi:Tol biopolymer transport system component
MRAKVLLLSTIVFFGVTELFAQIKVAVPAPLSNIERVSPWKDYLAPLWAPDGLHIAYSQHNYNKLYIIDVSSKEEYLLIEGPGCGFRPEWDESGDRLYFRKRRGSSLAPLEASVSLDGVRSEAFRQRREVSLGIDIKQDAIYRADRSKKSSQISGVNDKFYGPILSPDERYLVFQGISTGIYIHNIESGETVSIGQGDYPTWAPKSNAIFFDRTEDDGHYITKGDIYCYRLDDQSLFQLTNTPGIVEQRASVSPDGRMIAFDAQGAIFVGRLAPEVLR